jgi:hypothetical protein
MKRIGIDIKLAGNYPWIYINSINDKPRWNNGNIGLTSKYIVSYLNFK